MADVRNLASKYAKKVDERFNLESQVARALNSDYKFTGVKTVNIYSIPTAPMNDYTRSGSNRYGTPEDLTRNVQTHTIEMDRAFTFIIDKGDRVQSEMVMEAGKALSRQLKEVWVPEFDTYVYRKLAEAAIARGNYSEEAITKENAYEQFLAAMEYLGDKSIPDKGRIAWCSYAFANLLKQDPAFIKQGDKSQEIAIKGTIGEVDGCTIVKVPSSRLPAGCAFLVTHSCAASAPKQLEDYKTHTDPPGISGYLVEGRVIYDCFVLEEKADAIYYHGGQTRLRALTVTTAHNNDGTSAKVLVNPGMPEGTNKFVYKMGAAAQAVEFNADLSSWSALSKSGASVTKGANTHVTVAEVTADGKARAAGTALLK